MLKEERYLLCNKNKRINCPSIMPTQSRSFFPVQQRILGQQSSEWIQWPVQKTCKFYQVITFKSV